MNSEQKYEQIGILLEEIQKYDIYPIVARRLSDDFCEDGYYARAKFLCPFHPDKRVGSFSMKAQTFKCYSCGEKGNAITFVEKFDNLKFTEAVVQVAFELGIIDEKTAQDLNNNQATKMQYVQRSCVKKSTKKELASKEDINLVLSLFSKGLTYLGKPKLSEKHYNYLKKVRNLTDEQIEKRGYFTFPSAYIMKHFLKDLKAHGKEESILRQIAGFFYDTKKEKYSFSLLKNNSGIGIPILDENGLIVGIQIRLDASIGETRYIWFSSSFAEKGDFIYGNSSGAPIDVCYPNGFDINNIQDLKYQCIFITEGHFKAIRLAKEFNSIALSVQGVQNWKDLPYVLDTLQRANPRLRHIYLMYDADMSYKDNVLQASIKMGLSLTNLNFKGYKSYVENITAIRKDKYEETDHIPAPLHTFREEAEKVDTYLRQNAGVFKFNVQYCLWSDTIGKGIDDFLDVFETSDEATKNIKKVPLIDFWGTSYRYLCMNDRDRENGVLTGDKKRVNFIDIFQISDKI